MLNNTVTSAAEPTSNQLIREALQTYERHFGSPPEWLEELSNARILSLVQQALRRGAPLIAAEILH
jgi:hypothetical protein